MASILKAITKIDAAYEPDSGATIPVWGTFVDSAGEKRMLHFEIHNDGSGPVVWPGFWFLPYNGNWFNPVNLCKIKEMD